MKLKKIVFLFALGLVILSCSNNDGTPDSAAFSTYIINNQTSELLIYSSNVEIPISESKEISSAGGLGITNPPKPSIGLGSLTLFRKVDGILTTALEINPIIDWQWVERIISNNNSSFILTVTDDMLEPYPLSVMNFVDNYKMNFLEFKKVETITFSNGTSATSISTTVGSVFQNVNYTFNSNNTFTANGLYNTVTTVMDPNGNSTVGDPVIVSMDQSGTYSLNIANSKLIISDNDGESATFEIRDYAISGMTLYSEETIISNNRIIKTTLEYRFSR